MARSPLTDVRLHEVEIRDYDARDLEACLAVFDTNVPAYFAAAERDELATFLSALPGPYLVVLAGGAVIAAGGYARAEDEGTVDLCWGMVRRDLHGRGVGRKLTEARLDRALADERVDVVALRTSQHTTGFYERLGFRTVDVRVNGFGPGLDRCEMRLDVRGTR